MNIFQIDQAILNCLDMETGEIIDEDMLTSLRMQRDYKIENIALWIKELRAEIKAIADEVETLQDRKKVAENKKTSLEKYLKAVLDGEKFKTGKVSISYRRSESVQVDDITQLDKRFLRYAEPTADKTAIKKALKANEEVAGARLVINNNMIVG